tara:strand:- start:26210 stop:26629 length:420 start_codon:yes stop_codon:yes gene_type:complete
MNYKIVAKYIKDLNFKISDTKSFFLLAENIANYKVKINIKSNPIKEKIISIETTILLSPVKEDLKNIIANITHSTLIEFGEKINDKKKLEKIILVEVPTTIYPDLRKTFIHLFESSGFKNIKIDEVINFEKLYEQRKTQ